MNTSATFTLTLSHVHELMFQGTAVSVTVPGLDGECTILANHEPFITLLKNGQVLVTDVQNVVQKFEIEKGVLETSNGQVTILV